MAQRADGEWNRRLFGKIGKGDFSLKLSHVSRNKIVPTASWGQDFPGAATPGRTNNHTLDEETSVALVYDHDFSDFSNLNIHLNYSAYHSEGIYNYLTSWGSLNKDVANGKWWSLDPSYTFSPSAAHKLIVGAMYKDYFQQDQSNFDLPPLYFSYLNDKRSASASAVYINDEWMITDRVHLNAGIRYDHDSQAGGTLSPRVALLYRPVEAASIKLIYGEAYRSANAYELYYHDGLNTTKPAMNLKSEQNRTIELVWEQQWDERIATTVSLYNYKIKNLITQQLDPADGLMVFVNQGKVDGRGVELGTDLKWNDIFSTRLSYSYQQAKNTQSGTRRVNSPAHMGKAQVLGSLLQDRLSAGLELQYMSPRSTVAGGQTPAYTIGNLTLIGQHLVKGMELRASIYNLLDKTYSDPAGVEHTQQSIPQAGRNYHLAVSYTF